MLRSLVRTVFIGFRGVGNCQHPPNHRHPCQDRCTAQPAQSPHDWVVIAIDACATHGRLMDRSQGIRRYAGVGTMQRVMMDTGSKPSFGSCFLWDVDLNVDQFRRNLEDPDPVVRAYWMGKLMRQAKPDDVFAFVTLRQIASSWPALTGYLGQSKPFWSWLLSRWEVQGRVRR